MTYAPRPDAPRPAPGKSRASKVIMTVSIVVSLLAVAGGVLVLTLPDELEPADVASMYFEATKDADLVARLELVCERDREAIRERWGGTRPPQSEIDEVVRLEDLTYTIDEHSIRVDGEHATIRADLTATIDGEHQKDQVTVPMLYENGAWVVCGKVD